MGRLDELDTEKQIDRDEYRNRLDDLQLELLRYQLRIKESKRTVMLVFEGPDAAGKGGVIKRITEKLDPRLIRVYNIIKPSQDEYARHYMWRFWTKIPAQGEMAIFDRSWYGRVLVERVEKFCTDDEWGRAYQEMNDFERLHIDAGTLLLKFYLHISKDEQLRRFEKRAADPYKHWKISDEDWRNRRRWKDHLAAAEDMFDKTSTRHAPWHLIEGNYKWFARIKILRILARTFAKEF
jgi:polyphosphate kinase 2 (PPK2 family)